MRLVSCLAPCLAPLYRAVAEHLGVDFDETAPWEESERQLLSGQVELGFLCGLGYVRQPHGLEVLGAPVFAAPRYEDAPVYFSDLIVRADSPYKELADLRGCRWASNEPNSHSGSNVLRWHLRNDPDFFRQEIVSGSHARSIGLVQSGAVDLACIDSTVLEELRPANLRVIGTLGPSPIQPLLISTRIPLERREELRARLLSFPSTGPVRRFAPVNDAHYDPLRATLSFSSGPAPTAARLSPDPA